MHEERIVYQADRVFAGDGDNYLTDAAILVMDQTVTAVVRTDELGTDGAWSSATRVTFEAGRTVVPGLIDVHSHLIMPGDGTPYQELEKCDDSMLVLRALSNATVALQAGVTTIVDTGTRRAVLYSLRDAIANGLVQGPRLILSGPPITRTGGHCWFLGGEADGADGVRAMVRRLNKDGADIIKIMASGGGTQRSYPFRASYSQEEMTAAVEEAHGMGFKVFAHCSSIEGIQRAINAEIDIIFHCHFYLPSGELAYDSAITEQIASKEIYVNPTLFVNRVHIDHLEAKQATVGLSVHEQTELERRQFRYQGQVENVRRLYQGGVQLIGGSDAGWGLTGFTDIQTELECMVDSGMTPVQALHSVTTKAAKSLGLDTTIGSIASGRNADFVVINGDPTSDISALRNVEQVIQGGHLVV